MSESPKFIQDMGTYFCYQVWKYEVNPSLRKDAEFFARYVAEQTLEAVESQFTCKVEDYSNGTITIKRLDLSDIRNQLLGGGK